MRDRVFYKRNTGSIDILGIANKNCEQSVIDRILRVFLKKNKLENFEISYV